LTLASLPLVVWPSGPIIVNNISVLLQLVVELGDKAAIRRTLVFAPSARKIKIKNEHQCQKRDLNTRIPAMTHVNMLP